MANTKLSHQHEARILALVGAGKTNRQIAAELSASGVPISHTSISRFIKRSRSARVDAAKAVVREQLVGGLTEDLDRIELEASRLAKMAETIGAKIERGEAKASEHLRYLRIVDRLAKLTDLKLHYAGADTPDDKHDDSSAERVMAKIATILEREAPNPTIQ